MKYLLLLLLLASCSKPKAPPPTQCWQCIIDKRIYWDTVNVCQPEAPKFYDWDGRTYSKCYLK